MQKVRQMSAALSERDTGFVKLRAKIHGAPDAGDAQRVRDYAAGIENPELQAKYAELAQEIDKVYQAAPLPAVLEKNAQVFRNSLGALKFRTMMYGISSIPTTRPS